MTSIISVSVDDKQKQWLEIQKGRKDCGPTFLLRRAIHEKMQEMGDEYFEDIKTLRTKVEKLANMHQTSLKFIDNKGLTNEFLLKKEARTNE